MMHAGSLNQRITLQRATIARGAAGETSQTWGTLATVWANIRALRGREYYAAKELQAETSHEITIRFRHDVTPAIRVLFGSRVFNISSVINPGESNQWLVLVCEEAA